MRPLLVLATLFLFLSAFQFARASEEGDETLYAKAKRLFAMSEIPELDTVAGWRSGRCHFAEDENNSFGNVLVYEVLKSGSKMAVLGHDGGFAHVPERYDEIADQDREEIRAMWENAKQSGDLGNVESREGSLTVKNGDSIYSLRQISRYLILRIASQVNKSEIYCVFFRKIRSN